MDFLHFMLRGKGLCPSTNPTYRTILALRKMRCIIWGRTSYASVQRNR